MLRQSSANNSRLFFLPACDSVLGGLLTALRVTFKQGLAIQASA